MVRNLKSTKVLAVIFSLLFVVCLFAPMTRTVSANGVGIRITIWDDTTANVSGNISSFPDNSGCNFTVYLNKAVYVSNMSGVTLASGNGTATLNFDATIVNNSANHDWSCTFTSLEGEVITGITCYSVSHRATELPVVTETSATVPSVVETTLSSVAATETTIQATEATVAETNATVAAETTVTSGTTSIVEEVVLEDEETSEESIVETTAISEENTSVEEATPTEKPVFAGLVTRNQDTTKKSGFPVWLIVLLILAGVCGFRYFTLSKIRNLYGKDLLYEFIPGGVIGNVMEKINPSTRPAPTAEEAPVVVNGYLKTSNTKSIRPMYSNTPDARMKENEESAATANKAPVQKAPIKRPSSASVNKAQANKTQASKENETMAENKALKATTKAAASTAAASAKATAPAKRPTASADKGTPARNMASDDDSKRRRPARRPVDTMNRPDGNALNADAAPTAAALAFEKRQQEQSATPAIATAFVPPVIEKKEKEQINPFKPLTREDGSIIAPESNTTNLPGVASCAVPKVVQKQEINPFKSNQTANGLKAPIKRAASASVNHAQAAKDEAEAKANEDKASYDPTATGNMGIVNALGSKETHTTFKATAFVEQEKIDPFKRPTAEQ